MMSKEEGITHLRMNNKIEAKKCFENYLADLNLYKSETKDNGQVINNEITWAKTMIYKSR